MNEKPMTLVRLLVPAFHQLAALKPSIHGRQMNAHQTAIPSQAVAVGEMPRGDPFLKRVLADTEDLRAAVQIDIEMNPFPNLCRRIRLPFQSETSP